MESAHQFSSRPDCNNTAEVPSFTLRTALSAIPLVSDLCDVDVQWFQERSTQALPNSEELSVNDFRFPIWLRELLQAPLCFLRSFCFARICLDPLSGQVLHHDCISVIVSRFTTFTENFVICCYQVTTIFCTRYGSTIASSARCPCNFGPLTVWEDRTRQECQGPHYLKCTGNLSTTSWKMKLMARRKDKMIREKMNSIEKKVEKSKRNQTHNMSAWGWHMECDVRTPYLSHVCACHQMWMNEKMWRVRCAVHTLRRL